jgi:hypothetical protein
MPSDISAPAAIRMAVPGKRRLKKNERLPKGSQADNKDRPSRIGLYERKNRSRKRIH